MIFKAIKENLNGYFSWNKYVKHGHHDHKFGVNKLDYVCQIPVLGLGAIALFHMLVIIIGYGIIRPIQFIMDYKHERQKKSRS